MKIDPAYIAKLLNHLRGIYTVPINDGCGPRSGLMESTHQFPVPQIGREAAELIENLGQRITQLEAALQTIVEWKDFPATGSFWGDEPTREMSYSAAFGSNGERDYMRRVAEQVLLPPPSNRPDPKQLSYQMHCLIGDKENK
jgi:hypothetical protein